MDLWIQNLTIFLEKNKNFQPGVMLERMAHILGDDHTEVKQKQEE